METLSIRGVSQPEVVFKALLEECEEILPVFLEFLKKMKDPGFTIENDHSSHVALSQSLHRLRGSAGFMGLKETASLAKTCESALKENDSGLYDKLKELSSDIEALIKEIKA
jgi:HPt (histidine-containing phosphotransfer) domain-containing protein